jgi:hypothetical protein
VITFVWSSPGLMQTLINIGDGKILAHLVTVQGFLLG